MVLHNKDYFEMLIELTFLKLALISQCFIKEVSCIFLLILRTKSFLQSFVTFW